MSTFYATTAIDYPNGKPHIGHAFEKIITDILTRWHRLKGEETFFSTGTDEHGQKLEKYAKEAKKDPKTYVDGMIAHFIELCNLLHISHDTFIRTTDAHHEILAKELFDKALQKEDIYLGKYSGNYCIYDETFFTEKDLVDGDKCPICGRPTQITNEDAYFFKLGNYQQKIIDHIEEHGFIYPETRRNEILSRLKKEPLRDLCVSRTSFSWGIPLKNDPKHVIYVWFDALINYLSAIHYPDGEKSSLWPANVHVIGKDIIWFHTVIWPAMLMSLDIPLPKAVYAHGFILAKSGVKMGKSLGNAMDPFVLTQKYGSDPLRYYLAKIIPSADDGYFSEEELVTKYNQELGNDLGNLVMRCIKLSIKNIGTTINPPEEHSMDEEDIALVHQRNTIFDKADAQLKTFEYDKALNTIWAYVKSINVYLNKKEPWKVQDTHEFHNIMYNAIKHLSYATTMLKPFIPEIAEKIEKQIGVSRTFEGLGTENSKDNTTDSYQLTDAEALFPRIEFKKEEIYQLDIRVAEITKIEDHPDADKLYVLKINLGSEVRQIVAGLKEHYTKEQLEHQKILVVTNLEHAKLRGVESQGMLLAGVENNHVKVLSANDEIGTKVSITDATCENSTISFDTFKKFKIEIKNGKLRIDSKEITTPKGIITPFNNAKVY